MGSSSYRAGVIAKHMLKKRPRYQWNIFWCICLLLALGMVSIFSYQIYYYNSFYEKSMVYLGCQDDTISFLNQNFQISENAKVLNNSIDVIHVGAQVELKVSRITDELLEIKFENNVVYKVGMSVLEIASFAFCMIVYFGVTIFGFYVTNKKSPKKRIIKKMQKDMLLR